MTKKRYNLLMKNDDEPLTQKEQREGWHFCWDWDGLLISPDMGEFKFCTCPYTNLNQFIK
jgi:hypothetical protein